MGQGLRMGAIFLALCFLHLHSMSSASYCTLPLPPSASPRLPFLHGMNDAIHLVAAMSNVLITRPETTYTIARQQRKQKNEKQECSRKQYNTPPHPAPRHPAPHQKIIESTSL